jgi:hypothetical protein
MPVLSFGFGIGATSGFPLGLGCKTRLRPEVISTFEHIDEDFSVSLSRDPGEGSGNAFTLSQDDFHLIAVGPFWYQKRFGSTGLDRLLGDLKKGVCEESQLYGNYVLLIGHRGSWIVYCHSAGLMKIYRTTDSKRFSTSWLELCERSSKKVDLDAAHQYVLLGASHTLQTPVQDVEELPQGQAILVKGGPLGIRFIKSPQAPRFEKLGQLADAEQWLFEQLKTRFSLIVEAKGAKVCSALSAGFDSRMILAFLRHLDVAPRLVVYGPTQSEDVVIAKRIAKAENLEIHHTDKSVLDNTFASLDQETLSLQCQFFDGIPVDGFIEKGADRVTRIEQSEGDFLALNGGGGEIFRNFFHLSNKRFKAVDIHDAFYSAYSPELFKSKEAAQHFREKIAVDIQKVLGLPDQMLSREDVELVYSKYRCAFWMGRNNSVSNRYGGFMTPLFDEQLATVCASIPISAKEQGALQARLIARADKRIASYASSYGFDFLSGPNTRSKFDAFLNNSKPVCLRPLPSRLRFKSANFRYQIARRVNELRALTRMNPEDFLDIDLGLLPSEQAVERSFSLALALE